MLSQPAPPRPPPPRHTQLLAGAAPEERARWRLGADASAHTLTARGGCLRLPGVDDAADLAVTRHAMAAIGLGPDAQEQVFRILSALVHLSDLEFKPDSRDEDHCAVAAGRAASALDAAAALLGCDPGALAKALTTRTRVTPDGPIVSPLGAKAAAHTRDALSKVRLGSAERRGGGRGVTMDSSSKRRWQRARSTAYAAPLTPHAWHPRLCHRPNPPGRVRAPL
jgi:hypothetical protein